MGVFQQSVEIILMNHQKLKILLPTLLIIVFFLITACASQRRVVYERRPSPPPEKREIRKLESREPQYGIASWYGADFHGKHTSSGEVYDMYQLTCAHQTLPLGTMVMVTNLENGRSLELKVNDRGPFVKERIIDVSYAAAQMLGMWEKGTASVKVEVIGSAPELVQRFTLQVGSFVDENNAQKLAEQLRKNFDNVFVTALETQTQKYHRVRVGQFDTRESALVIAKKLAQMGFNVMVTEH
jgi:rare lipoprotein A